MPTLILNEIECINPQEARDDEPYLDIFTENMWRWKIWGPRRMEALDLIDLRERIDPIQFNGFARVILREEDRVGRDDTIGDFIILPPVSAGTRDVYLPSEIVTSRSTSYRINYEIREEPSSRPRNRIELLSLRCDDAQGRKDRVYLKVYKRLLWGPHEMKSGDMVTFENLHLDFHDIVYVYLHETRGQNWRAGFRLTAREYRINTRLNHVFSKDRGIVGDAQYTLVYRMRWLPAR